MLTPFGTSGVSPLNRAKTYYSLPRHSASQKAVPDRKYDAYDTFSAASAGKSSFQMNLVGRLSQEVRTSTTTGDIQELRRSVASGEYRPDPMSIARSILLMAEE